MGRSSSNGNEKDLRKTGNYTPGKGLFEKCCNSQTETCLCPRRAGIPQCTCKCDNCDCWAFQ